ncbi:hypothetical protein [Cellulomonas aerilata]|uniref:Cobalt transporter n=1 Tax=Cellulomonas aerilata TaxID=515326 RepID=A0A512DE17_9CELL|nr:hypothetical protein [Cellulomonas aerilata]GEO34713.1 hypothetical protein CAE01nite_24380 [Cellulomonas aerilata]
MGRRRRHAGRAAVAVVVTLGVAVTGVVVALDRLDGPDVVEQRCTADLDGTPWHLSPTQSDNAALVVAATVRRGMPARAATIGIATALQESRLVNIDYGDRDSVGLFQQRPSQGWGTVEQIMDPVYSTGAFYDVLAEVDGYEGLEITDAAQRVQRSGFPEAYAQHEVRARAWASGLTGYSPATVTCALAPAEGPGSPDALLDRAARDFGALPGTVADDGAVVLDATALPAGDGEPARLAWAVAQWSVAVADGQSVRSVTVEDRTWTRGQEGWASSGTAALPAGEVRVTLAS